MASSFYLDIIEEEKEKFKLGSKSLTAAAYAVSGYHWKRSIGKRPFLLDYNKPSNRCAYLYKFGTINSGLVTKYFRKLSKAKAVKNILHSKKSLKVCCFGGGPGTDVFGVFKALTVNPRFHGKISEVTVLDKCGGWNNMFTNIMSGLLDGKVKDIPATFINQDNFKHMLIEVDLLDPLPQNVIEIISSADIVCMTRFLSDVIGDERSSHAMEVLGNLIKLEALVLYTDIFNEKVFEFTEDISKDNGLVTVLGPLHEKFHRPVAVQKDVFGMGPQFVAKFSIVGWCKTSDSSGSYLSSISDLASEDLSASIYISDSEENYERPDLPLDLDSDIDIVSSENEDFKASVKASNKSVFTYEYIQTEENYVCINDLPVISCDERGQVESNVLSDSVSSEDIDLAASVKVNYDPIFLCDESTQIESNVDIASSKNQEALVKASNHSVSTCNEYTQTELNLLLDAVSIEDLEALVKATFNLLNVIEHWKQKCIL